MLEHIQQRIANQQALLASLADLQGHTVAQIGAQITQILLSEGRVFTCGTGLASGNAQLLATALNHRLDRERPSLPAICLNNDASLINAITIAHGSSQAYAHQSGPIAARRIFWWCSA